jgi:hypothetical protein
MAERSRRANWAVGLSLFAVAWGLAILLGAFALPAYNDGSTLVDENGAWVAVPVAVPALLASIAFTGLHRRCTSGSTAGLVWAWSAVAVLVAFAVVAILSIGVFALVPALALACAAKLTPQGAASA